MLKSPKLATLVLAFMALLAIAPIVVYAVVPEIADASSDFDVGPAAEKSEGDPLVTVEEGFSIGLTALLTTAATWMVRKAKGEQALADRPHVLAWTSVAASILAGGLSSWALGGVGFVPALKSAVFGWVSSQAPRRGKKFIPALAKAFK